MTIEISPATEELLMERMQTGWFASVDAALYQALDLSPPTKRERELMKVLREVWSDDEAPAQGRVAVDRSSIVDGDQAMEPTWRDAIDAAQTFGGYDLDIERGRVSNPNRDIDLS